MTARIDPHAHTIRSDGTDTPRGLIQQARRQGLDVVAITDHDTMSGWEEAEQAAREFGVGLLRGVEVSSVYENNSVHVLGYLMNPGDRGLNSMFEDAVSSRETRLAEMAQNLTADYPLLEWEAILQAARGASLGRPHLADALVQHGYFPTRNAAFEWALHPSGPYFVPQVMTSPVEVVRGIRRAGGVPVLAHPKSGTRGWQVPDDLIAEMAEAGLFGIERDHRDHSASARIRVDQIANDLGLAATGGSDYHGSGKPNVLGENLLDPYILAQMESEGLEEVIRG